MKKRQLFKQKREFYYSLFDEGIKHQRVDNPLRNDITPGKTDIIIAYRLKLT